MEKKIAFIEALISITYKEIRILGRKEEVTENNNLKNEVESLFLLQMKERDIQSL